VAAADGHRRARWINYRDVDDPDAEIGRPLIRADAKRRQARADLVVSEISPAVFGPSFSASRPFAPV
jgi:hypothetical protein